jgi:hypothetical protein
MSLRECSCPLYAMSDNDKTTDEAPSNKQSLCKRSVKRSVQTFEHDQWSIKTARERVLLILQDSERILCAVQLGNLGLWLATAVSVCLRQSQKVVTAQDIDMDMRRHLL